jgi:hypothetical protein
MRGNILEEMLLIQEPSVFRLYQEMMKITGYFIAPVFTIALLIEYFGEMDFGAVVRKLLLITIFMGSFYQFHSKAVELSLETASYTLNKVSPRNLFVKKWFHVKVRTKEQKQWSFLESFAIPNLNDLVATAFFLLAKVFIWLLKLIYSSVYHLTYVFSGLTAILFFLGWTKDAIKGTFQASLWCMFLPFVIVAILSLVGNSIDETAISGGLVVAKIDAIIWLFGITLLLLISPLITFGMIKGEGIHSFGSKMGAMVVSSGLKATAIAPFITDLPSRISQTTTKLKSFGSNLKGKVSNTSFKADSLSKGGDKVNLTSQDQQSLKNQHQANSSSHNSDLRKMPSSANAFKNSPIMTVSGVKSSSTSAIRTANTNTQNKPKELLSREVKTHTSRTQSKNSLSSTNQMNSKMSNSSEMRSIQKNNQLNTRMTKTEMSRPRREKREQL